jgi:hypothetical protein
MEFLVVFSWEKSNCYRVRFGFGSLYWWYSAVAFSRRINGRIGIGMEGSRWIMLGMQAMHIY